jgi:hypothetical protein
MLHGLVACAGVCLLPAAALLEQCRQWYSIMNSGMQAGRLMEWSCNYARMPDHRTCNLPAWGFLLCDALLFEVKSCKLAE